MNRQRFAGIQWKTALFSLGLSFFISVISLIAVVSAYRLEWSVIWSFHPSRLVMPLLLIAFLGLLPGYFFGSRLKRRVRQLGEFIYFIERGDFTSRVPDRLVHERDELGIIGDT
ncbi:hypothetical protein LJK88_27620 [Paenibacillus sp. P26]|nr:hypothetical protein LJK88_27620 [Paenibacillus sp. P26]